MGAMRRRVASSSCTMWRVGGRWCDAQTFWLFLGRVLRRPLGAESGGNASYKNLEK